MEVNVEVKPKKIRSQRYIDWSLGMISFTESSFLPILVDPFLVAMTLARPKCWWRFVLISTFASVLGGVFGYILGAVFFDFVGVKLIAFYSLENAFTRTVEAVGKNAFIFTIVGAFTPIPYKIVALVAGFLKINIFVFIVASIVGRFARFWIVGFVTKQFGEHALGVFKRRFGVLTVAVVFGVGLYLVMAIAK